MRHLPDSNQLPHALYRADQVRALDRAAIDDYGIPGVELMGRAGAAAYRLLRDRWPEARRLVVLCGGGNNGGDGYEVARLARADGLAVEVLALAQSPRTSRSRPVPSRASTIRSALGGMRSKGRTSPPAFR